MGPRVKSLPDSEVVKLAAVVAEVSSIFLALKGCEMSIQTIHDWIEFERPISTAEERQGSLFTSGLAFGFAIIDKFGGEWVDGYGVRINENLTAFPVNKVWKQFENGSEDSILSFWEALPTLVERARGDGDPSADIPLKSGGRMVMFPMGEEGGD